MSDKIKLVTFDTIRIIAKLSDGSYREVLTTEDEANIILNILKELHGGSVKVRQEQLEGIEFKPANP